MLKLVFSLSSLVTTLVPGYFSIAVEHHNLIAITLNANFFSGIFYRYRVVVVVKSYRGKIVNSCGYTLTGVKSVSRQLGHPYSCSQCHFTYGLFSALYLVLTVFEASA